MTTRTEITSDIAALNNEHDDLAALVRPDDQRN